MKQINQEKKIPSDMIGDIAILKFSRETSEKEKTKLAKGFLEKNKQIKTLFEKTGKIKGRLRKADMKFLAGEKKEETIYKENGCLFKFNIKETYFSPRLSWNRQRISEDVLKRIPKLKSKPKSKKEIKILVMFAGVAPYPIVLGRLLKLKAKKAEIISSEINAKACKYAEENVRLNKLQDYIKVIAGDSKKIGEKLKKLRIKTEFDFILMPRPNLKETFLKETLALGKKGTRYYYHGFGTEESVREEFKDYMKKISGFRISRAGDIAPNKSRWLVEFERR